MTDRIALILAAFVTAALAVDHFAFRSQGLIFAGRELTAFIDFLEFWR
ncbi:hypothetical protein [Solirhodobacter olei]|nr:hypothetical protein [Solirhodobacter olei]